MMNNTNTGSKGFVTVDTITDVQIRALLMEFVGNRKRRNAYVRSVISDCRGALAGARVCRESVVRA